MAHEDGPDHARDGSKSITLENAANSNKPNNIDNEQEIEEENNPMMKMLQAILKNQTEATSNMENTIETIRNDIKKIKNNHQEIIETVNQAKAKSDEAQTTAEEAKVRSSENNLKINKVQQDIKTIKTMQQEINNHKDETMEEIKDMKSSVDQNKKDIAVTNNKIEDIYSSIDVINRELAAKASTNISVDNPDPLAITDVFMEPPPPQMHLQIIKPMSKEEQEKQQDNKIRYILDIARKRVGLKPVTPEHISQHAKK